MERGGGGKQPTVTADSAGVGCKISAILSWKSDQIESYRVLEVLKQPSDRRNCQERLTRFTASNVVNMA